MAYRIRPQCNVAKEVRSAALDRIDEARRALKLPAAQRAEGVHQARKRFKELRALLRLVREPLGDSFQRENRCARDLGRALAESREATAMLGRSMGAVMHRWRDASRGSATLGAKLFSVQVSAGDQNPNGFQT